MSARELDIRALTELLRARRCVTAAWLFGSAKEGIVRAGSDVDIAVLTDGRLSLDDQLGLCHDLQLTLGVEGIDLICLNDASPILAFEAICGRLLFRRAPDVHAAFSSLTARQYEDEMAMCRRQLAQVR
jgi:predicted nucleotidyltransferase